MIGKLDDKFKCHDCGSALERLSLKKEHKENLFMHKHIDFCKQQKRYACIGCGYEFILVNSIMGLRLVELEEVVEK